MIAELFLKAKVLLNTEHAYKQLGYNTGNITQIKTDLRLLHPQHYEPSYNSRCQHQMQAFFIEYFCKDFSSAPASYTPEHHHCGLFHDLKSPSYRATLTQHLPQAISRLLHASRHSLNNDESSKKLVLSPSIKQHMLLIANKPPFAQQQIFNDFSQMKTHMEHNEFLAVICTAFLQQHCLNTHTCDVEKDLFAHGLRNAYISLCLAQNQKQDGLSAFINGFLHFISLIYLHRELQACEVQPAKDVLQNEITQFLPRFNYWLAKDWGLPDDMLSALRERFIENDDLSSLAIIMQTADHANLALMLFQERLINRKQTLHYLNTMHLGDYHLLQKLFSTAH